MPIRVKSVFEVDKTSVVFFVAVFDNGFVFFRFFLLLSLSIFWLLKLTRFLPGVSTRFSKRSIDIGSLLGISFLLGILV